MITNIRRFWFRLTLIWSNPVVTQEIEKTMVKELGRAHLRIQALEDLMKEHLVIGVDIGAGPKDGHYAVVIGRYHGHDYVRTFALEGDQFTHIVDSLRGIYRRHRRPLMFVDAPPAFAHHIRQELDHDR